MRKIILFVAVMMVGSVNGAWAQAPNWAWAKSAGEIGDERGHSISTDKNGNTYVTGYCSSSAISFGNFTFTNPIGSSLIFIVKYATNGNVIWAKSIEGINENLGKGIALDLFGNIYITGHFKANSIYLGNYILNKISGRDMFVAKFNSAGNIVWAKNAGGNSEGNNITIDASGNVIVIGDYYLPSMNIDTYTLTNTDTSGNTNDIFVVKYDSSGNVLWAKNSGGGSYEWGMGVAADENGNIYTTGGFNSDFFTSGSITLTSSVAGSPEIFIQKFDSSGNQLWIKQSTGGQSDECANDISVDKNGNIFITGGFDSKEFQLDSRTVFNYDTSSMTSDIFIAKYNTNGDAVWAKNAGEIGDDGCLGLSLDSTDNIYITGYCYGYSNSTTTFGTIGISNKAGEFIAKYDSTGTALWARMDNSSNSTNTGSDISTINGCVYVVGDFMDSTMDLGSYHFINANNSGNKSDIFIAKLNATTGIEELPTSSIFIYPNPTTGIITIKGITQPTVAVYNLMGQKVVSAQGSNEVNLAQLPAGMYMVQVFNKDMELVKSEKIILNR